MSKIVELFTPEGEWVQYRPLSVRLPAFLAVYGPERGYAVETAMQDSLSLKSGLLKLYEIALQVGRKPEEVGLPPLSTAGQTLVCRAILRDSAGRVLAIATAAKCIQSYKDLEVLETAARQRLLAALGFGGEALDADETQDQADQSLAPSLAPVPAPTPVSVPAIVPIVPSAKTVRETPASNQDAGTPSSNQDAPVAEDADEVIPLDEAAGTSPVTLPSVTAPSASDRDARALSALIRQIKQQARVRGFNPPVVTTRQEAQAALQRLLRRD